MISVTLNSKKGNNLAVYPETPQINSYVVTTATVPVNTNVFSVQPNNTIMVGDTFVWHGLRYTIGNSVGLGGYYITPNIGGTNAIPAGTILFISTTGDSRILGHKISSGIIQGPLPAGSSLISTTYPQTFNALSIISPYSKIMIGTDTYSITKICASANVTANMIEITPPLQSATVYNTTIMNVYSQTYNRIMYNIDSSIFEDGKKYELSFSFTSHPCILNQFMKPALVYINLGTNDTYETDYNNLITTNLLGYLKPNFIHSNMSTATALYGNVSYSTLIEASNKPILIKKFSTNYIIVTIVDDDLIPFVDNSNVGIFPPYKLTLHFKEYKE